MRQDEEICCHWRGEERETCEREQERRVLSLVDNILLNGCDLIQDRTYSVFEDAYQDGLKGYLTKTIKPMEQVYSVYREVKKLRRMSCCFHCLPDTLLCSMKNICIFATAFPKIETVTPLVTQLSWSHFQMAM